MSLAPPTPRRGQAGVALIVVLWAVALISAAMLGLAAILQRQLGQEVAALQNSRAVLVAESGVQMALHPGIEPASAAEASRALTAELSKGWGGVNVRFEVRTEDLRGEEGKINLNAFDYNSPAGRESVRRILTNLLGLWGVSPTTSSAFLDCLIDFMDADRFVTGTNEAAEEVAKNGPLERLDDVTKIPGWDRVMRESTVTNWRSKFTIYGSGRLSLKSADQDLLEAWLELAPGRATAFVQDRSGADKIEGSLDDRLNPQLLGTLSAENQARIDLGAENLWRVTSTGYVGGVKRTLVALITRNPPQVRARWMEDAP